MHGTSWFHGNFGKFKILFFGTIENRLVGIAGFTVHMVRRSVMLKSKNITKKAAKAIENNQMVCVQ